MQNREQPAFVMRLARSPGNSPLLASTPLLHDPVLMRSAWRLLVGCSCVLGLALEACGGASDPGVVVQIATPAPTATAAAADASVSASASPTSTATATPELMLSATQVYQAGALLVSVTGGVSSGSISFLGREYPLTKGAKSMYSFVGVDTEDATGPQELKVNFLTPNGTKGSLTDTVQVLRTDWTVDSLQFDPATSQLLDPAIVNAEFAELHSIYTKVTPEKLWSGAWIAPVDAPVTARYGEQRSINGGPPSGHHGGTDLGAPEGTPVKAANSGRVVLARHMQVRGNMVIIDHGGGLYSAYCHLSAFNVSAGQAVEQGEVLGMSGNTGLSTGAHLHWEMAIDGVLLDALRFTDGTNGI